MPVAPVPAAQFSWGVHAWTMTLCIGDNARPLPDCYKIIDSPTSPAGGVVSICKVKSPITGQTFVCQRFEVSRLDFTDREQLYEVSFAAVQPFETSLTGESSHRM